MKLPHMLETMFRSTKSKDRELVLSLILDPTYVMASCWEMGKKGIPAVLHQSGKIVPEDSWELRTQAADKAIVDIEQAVGTESLRKTVLGLTAQYLTGQDEIRSAQRAEIKGLMHSLSLEPLGFVPVYQAIVYRMKQEEGIPPNVILLGVSGSDVSVHIYKIGLLAGNYDIDWEEGGVDALEEKLKHVPNVDVLPTKMLLYGGDAKRLDNMKDVLIHHPWQTRVNFLHFPKIDIVPAPYPLVAVSMAGASEIAKEIETGQQESVHTAYSQPSPAVNDAFSKAKIRDETLADAVAHGTGQPVEVVQEILGPADKIPLTPDTTQDDANVVPVSPESVGFHEEEVRPNEKRTVIEATSAEEEDGESLSNKPKRGRMHFPPVPQMSISFPSRPIIMIAVSVIALLFSIAGALWLLPRATVTILIQPKSISRPETVIVDPDATGVDKEHNIIAGQKTQSVVSGEKTIAVTGKKKVGDPAKGSVTVYNKSLTSKNMKKGAVLSAGSLKFTLDSDVSIASASESVGSITFGKTPTAVTARDIGSQSNLPANTEFVFADISSSILIARNDQAFSGGTSRDVTVVTRADYDALVKSVSDTLRDEGKQKLESSLSADLHILDNTIKTTVTSKSFDQELDEQTTQLNGTVTLTIEAIAYKTGDLLALFDDETTTTLPEGYTLEEGKSNISVSSAKLNKDGTITLVLDYKASAIPSMDTDKIRSELVGKSVEQATEYVRTLPGVAGVRYQFAWSLSQQRLPTRLNNITLVTQVP